MTSEERIRRAELASELIQNPLLADAMVSLEQNAVDQWKFSQPQDTATRELAFRRYEAVVALRDELKSWISDGRWAEADHQRKSL